MYVKERDRFDINQGEIGDCWFLAALANLADDDDAFDKVVPRGQNFGSSYCGIFRFRFFRFGEWVEVVGHAELAPTAPAHVEESAISQVGQ